MVAKPLHQQQKLMRGVQPRTTVGTILKSDAIALYQKGQTLQQIAEQAGVTRERIRQILVKVGVTFQSPAIQRLREAKLQKRKQAIVERQQAEAAHRAAQRAEKRRLYEEKVAKWSELWRSGHSLKQMGVILGLTKEAVGLKINYFRKHESEALFPRRKLTYSVLPMPRRLRHLWSSGMTVDEIAMKMGVTYHHVRSWLERARKQYGVEAFPYHDRVDDEYSQKREESDAHYTERLRKLLQPLKRGWAEWVTIQDLANSINIPHHRIYPLIASARLRFGWFPKRDSEKRAALLIDQLRRELAQANRLWRSGMPAPKIAKALGIPLKQLWRKIYQARRVMGTSWFAR